ncbi:hypothetical protein H6F88_19200 [Oculatella sp. FACHB-28]|uniref:type II toxin-antitoxin system antitoxin SocA domain-containing protein n=1 Tax=Oculatella sp. FACHB-28 TaxID=2692845 RepID=UPI0016847426|nr:type II toxin-antitoxin system antitoxin SocA domain-containing protein [Oculatella sp. FACHB-28]MBD2058113.1 hypothetical protein [Oculatella sp. FACHB-28]
MSDLKSIIKYIVSRYPKKTKLSKIRLIKIIYLADWRSAIVRGKQITSIKWKFGDCGLEPDVNIELPEKKDFGFLVEHLSLSQEDKEVLDHAMKTSAEKNWAEFVSIVYSTYPILNQNSSEAKEFDLIQLANLYKDMKNEQMQRDKTLFDTDFGIRLE